MPPTVSYECCGAIYAQSSGANGESLRFCRDCPRRYLLTLRRFTKPEGFEAGQPLGISDLIEIKGAGR